MDKKNMDLKIEMTPIGYVENDYLEPVYDENVYRKVSKLILNEEFVEGLQRIEELDKLQILFYFSKSNDCKLVLRRRIDGELSGVFASRTPHRPNGIGLTLVDLLKVEGNVLHVKGLDAINGTPVIDIKPYIARFDNDSE